MARHHRNILAPIAQRRDLDRHHAQPIVQVLAESAGADLAAKLPIRRSNDPDIDLDAARPPYPLKSLLLQDAHNLALGFERHIGDLVEEQRAAMRTLKGADLARRPIAAKFGPEQLDLEPVGPHRRAVDRNKRALRTARMQMQQPPDDFLSGTRRSCDQHSAARRCHALDLLPQLVGRRRYADEIDISASAQLQLLVLTPELCRFDRTLDD